MLCQLQFAVDQSGDQGLIESFYPWVNCQNYPLQRDTFGPAITLCDG